MASLSLGASIYNRNGEYIETYNIYYLDVFIDYNFYNDNDTNKGKVSVISSDIVVKKNTSTGTNNKTKRKTKKFNISKKKYYCKKR